jgi:hypothetical protein
MSAVLKWYRKRYPTARIWYKDNNRFVSARYLFPEGLVDEWDQPADYSGYLPLKEHNLWIWAPYLRYKGIYTELKDRWENFSKRYDVVFCPVISPEYNPQRGFDIDWSIGLFREICQKYKDSVFVIDKNKLGLVQRSTQDYWMGGLGLWAMKDFYETFDVIKRSKVFVGGDSGTSHYAGGIGHREMILLYGEQQENQAGFEWQRIEMAKDLMEPELFNPVFNFDSRPGCPRENFDTLWLFNNKVRTDAVLYLIEKHMNKFYGYANGSNNNGGNSAVLKVDQG